MAPLPRRTREDLDKLRGKGKSLGFFGLVKPGRLRQKKKKKGKQKRKGAATAAAAAAASRPSATAAGSPTAVAAVSYSRRHVCHSCCSGHRQEKHVVVELGLLSNSEALLSTACASPADKFSPEQDGSQPPSSTPGQNCHQGVLP